jgi:hypothetical protein
VLLRQPWVQINPPPRFHQSAIRSHVQPVNDAADRRYDKHAYISPSRKHHYGLLTLFRADSCVAVANVPPVQDVAADSPLPVLTHDRPIASFSPLAVGLCGPNRITQRPLRLIRSRPLILGLRDPALYPYQMITRVSLRDSRWCTHAHCLVQVDPNPRLVGTPLEARNSEVRDLDDVVPGQADHVFYVSFSS